MQDVTPELQRSLGKGAPERGALVGKVEPGSPADKAGLRPGDIIAAVGSKSVDGSRAVQREVLARKIGDKIDLTLWRDGKTLHAGATTVEMPDEGKGGGRGKEGRGQRGDDEEEGGGGGKGARKLGLVLQSLTPGLAQRLGIERSARGAVIAEVRADSPAADAGLRPGDVIIAIDHKEVTGAEDAARLLSSRREGGHLCRVRRGDAVVFVPLPGA